MKIKNFIIPLIIIGIFSIIYFLVIPSIEHKKLSKKFIESFENSLNNLNINYKKEELDAKEYGAIMAYSYIADDKKIMLYVYNKNNNKYKKGKKDGFIVSSKNADFRLYGIFMNNTVLYMEEGFPNDDEILKIFTELSENLK